ncbi:hypothetical protein OHA98_00010 [Streptomyces sp. NBC_00654]|uniref:hypothetical protein n=1 Tax=Streptomyces sp. NBC_00654 TaxID=2975799 RepID=UPI002251A913|nr:hypothetical protein [Streptomyces sp. NBC_00654]MCX4963221.1 hypothetical protein [Streptomyces sp. NBC_00654]
MVEEIKNCNTIQVLGSENGPLGEFLGGADSAFRTLYRLKGIELDPSMKRSFHRHNGLGIYWRGTGEQESLAGEFRLVQILDAIIGGAPKWLTQEGWPEGDIALHSDFRIFDSQFMGGVGTFAALRMQSGAQNPEVWYFNVTYGSLKLDIGYADYMDYLLLTRGIYYWQYLFSEIPAEHYNFETIGSELEKSIDFLEEKFPESDYSELRSRLAVRIARHRSH